MTDIKHKPLIIAGPTASGKSAYALSVAHQSDGIIINADSMQIYQELPILTAHPDANALNSVPHKLYGHLKGDDYCSAARWRAIAIAAIQECHELNQRPILVGGTGLYLLALVKGLSEIPETDPAVREQARNLCTEMGTLIFYQNLAKLDPLIVGKLNSNDTQRLVRAYEVIISTGKSIVEWQNASSKEPGMDCEIQIINRPREELHLRAAQRFDQMLAQGALNEVKQLLSLNYASDLPIMRALGVPELTRYINGEIDLASARELSIIATRQYIKRQCTFFKNQFKGDELEQT